MRAPLTLFAELLISVLERGIVLVVRLDGPPGDRRLLCGVGLPDAADPILMALCATSMYGTRSRSYDYDDDFWDE